MILELLAVHHILEQSDHLQLSLQLKDLILSLYLQVSDLLRLILVPQLRQEEQQFIVF